MAEKQGIPLTSIDGFPEAAASKLAELWITTAEELVSTARQEGGIQSLAEHLGLPEDEVTDLVEGAVAVLPPDVSFAPDDVMAVGLGAMDEEEGAEPDAEPVSFAALPGQVDLRDRMPPVRDQGMRGTCVAHAGVAVREFLLGEASTEGDLSEQFLYWACKQRDGYAGSGTWIRVAMASLREAGVCVEQVWPYNPNPVANNEGQGPPPDEADDDAEAYKIESSMQQEPRWVTNLKEALAADKPVAFAVPVFRYWQTRPVRDTGDIRMPLPADQHLGGHAMCMVGFEDDPEVPGGGFFLVRNSWGTDWAPDSIVEAGYARLPYEYMTQYGRSAYTATAPAPGPKPDPEPKPTDDGGLAAWLRRLWDQIFGA
jgi:hypothetical protein